MPDSSFDKDSFSTAAKTISPLLMSEISIMLVNYWRQLAQSGAPTRWSIDPLKLVPCLPKVFMMQFNAPERTLSYVLAGEDIQAGYEFSLVDRTLADIVPEDAYGNVSAYFLACVEKPAIVLLSGRLFQEKEQPGLGERILLPLFAEPNSSQATGLIGLTFKQKDFPDRMIAYRDSKRILHIVPIDGSEATSAPY